jgi:hypothetical protein
MGNGNTKQAAAAPPPPAQSTGASHMASIEKMSITIDNLSKRKTFLEKKMKAELLEAKKKNASGDKKGALLNLKRKKLMEKQLATLETTVLNLEHQKLKIEEAITNAETFQAVSFFLNYLFFS